jgi:hypothetical protein
VAPSASAAVVAVAAVVQRLPSNWEAVALTVKQ